MLSPQSDAIKRAGADRDGLYFGIPVSRDELRDER